MASDSVTIDLELPINNLYRNGRLLVFSADGEQSLIRDKIATVGTIEDDYYTVKKNDQLFQIAWKYYSKTIEDSSKFWWVIADANNIHNPFDLSSYLGKEILIPNILNILLNI